MNKYINADELMKIIKTHHYMLANAINSRDYGMFTTGIEQAISETESIEVVRCKDCNNSYIAEDGNRICKQDEYTGIIVTDNDYCSYGERKETDEMD